MRFLQSTEHPCGELWHAVNTALLLPFPPWKHSKDSFLCLAAHFRQMLRSLISQKLLLSPGWLMSSKLTFSVCFKHSPDCSALICGKSDIQVTSLSQKMIEQGMFVRDKSSLIDDICYFNHIIMDMTQELRCPCVLIFWKYRGLVKEVLLLL